MNRTSIIGLTALALVVGTALGASLGGSTADAAIGTVKVAVIDLERTLSDTGAGKRASEKFEKARKAKQAQFDKQQRELQQLAAELNKQATVLKPEVLADRQDELEKKYVALQQSYVKLEKDLAEARSQAIQEVLKSAEPHIHSVAKAEGVHLIVDASAVVWADKAIDLTDEVGAKMK